MPKAWVAPFEPTSYLILRKICLLLIRYPFFGCVILALSACGSSGSSRLLEPEAPPTDSTPAQPTASYPGVEYLITNILAAREKYGTTTTNDDGTPVTNDDGTPTVTPAPLPGRSGAQLSSARDLIVARTNRYLSVGGTLIRTDQGNVVSEPITNNAMDMGTSCSDETATDAAQCVFPADALRMEATTFSFGLKNPDGVSFASDREPVMHYRGVDMSQVRTADSEEVEVYEDGDGNKYLLTSANVTGMNLTGVDLPADVMTAPDFADLLAVYSDADGNRYLLTPANVSNMDLMDVELPAGVTTAPDFASLSKVTESRAATDENYVGYDGILKHSIFFVGVDRFYDADGDLMHMRLGHASLGRIYDDDTSTPGVQMPTVSLTGEGVMVGVESRKNSLEHYLVQGDVNIDYSPFVEAVEADNTATPPVEAVDEMDAMIDISIDNIVRLNDDGEAWYAGSTYAAALTWRERVVTDSEFSYNQPSAVTAMPGTLRGSFYGTEAEPEVGGVFHHESPSHEIVGSFGSKLSEPPPPDPGNGN